MTTTATVQSVSDTRRPIYWVGGSKGGVGKSMMTSAMLDYLLAKEVSVALIESDTSNPDVWKAYKDFVPVELINLDESDGWVDLVDACDQHRDRVVVVNTAARNNLAVRDYAQTLASCLEDLRSKLVALWMINRQRDSLGLLTEFVQAVPTADVHVVRNGYFGAEDKFDLYNSSHVRQSIERRGGKSVTFPHLANRVADDLCAQRLALSVAAKSLPIGNRAELGRWRSEVRKVLSEVIS